MAEFDFRGEPGAATRSFGVGTRWWLAVGALPLLAACAFLATSPPSADPPRVLDITAIVNESAPPLTVVAAAA